MMHCSRIIWSPIGKISSAKSTPVNREFGKTRPRRPCPRPPSTPHRALNYGGSRYHATDLITQKNRPATQFRELPSVVG